MSKIAIISSDYLPDADVEEKESFENQQLKEHAGKYFDDAYFISPSDISIELRSSVNLASASISVIYNEQGKGQLDLCTFDAVLIRRTRGFAEQVFDIVDALAQSGNVLIIDNPESFVRPLSKIGPYLQRWGKFHQPDMVISMGKTIPKPLPISYPLTLKPTHGFRGNEVETIHNSDDVETYLSKYGGDDFGYGLVIQEHLNNHEEYRVFVIGGKATGCVLKSSDDSAAKNAFRGAEFIRREIYDVITLAERCALTQKIDIAGVDILRHNGNLYILECNRNPEFKKFQMATDIAVADEIFSYIKSRTQEIAHPESIPNLSEAPSQSTTNNYSYTFNHIIDQSQINIDQSQINHIQNTYGLTTDDVNSLIAAFQNDAETEKKTSVKSKANVSNWLGERFAKIVDKVGPDAASKLTELVFKLGDSGVV